MELLDLTVVARRKTAEGFNRLRFAPFNLPGRGAKGKVLSEGPTPLDAIAMPTEARPTVPTPSSITTIAPPSLNTGKTSLGSTPRYQCHTTGAPAGDNGSSSPSPSTLLPRNLLPLLEQQGTATGPNPTTSGPNSLDLLPSEDQGSCNLSQQSAMPFGHYLHPTDGAAGITIVHIPSYDSSTHAVEAGPSTSIGQDSSQELRSALADALWQVQALQQENSALRTALVESDTRLARMGLTGSSSGPDDQGAQGGGLPDSQGELPCPQVAAATPAASSGRSTPALLSSFPSLTSLTAFSTSAAAASLRVLLVSLGGADSAPPSNDVTEQQQASGCPSGAAWESGLDDAAGPARTPIVHSGARPPAPGYHYRGQSESDVGASRQLPATPRSVRFAWRRSATSEGCLALTAAEPPAAAAAAAAAVAEPAAAASEPLVKAVFKPRTEGAAAGERRRVSDAGVSDRGSASRTRWPGAPPSQQDLFTLHELMLST